MEVEMRPDELYHWGRKGMKWYQNIFTKGKTGSKRKKASETDQGEDDDSSDKKSGSSSKKTVDDISTEDLRKRTDRLTAEKNYFDAERNRRESYDKLYPQAEPKVKESFTKKFLNEAVKPALVEAGRRQLENYMNKKIEELTKGKVNKDSIEYLKKMSEKQGYKTKIAENTQKMMEANKKIKEYQDSERAAKEESDRKAAIKKQVDDYNNSGHESDSVRYTTYAKKGEDIADRYTRTGMSSNLPAVVNRTVTSLAHTPMGSKEFASKARKGESWAYTVEDMETGEILGRFNADGSRKRWWQK